MGTFLEDLAPAKRPGQPVTYEQIFAYTGGLNVSVRPGAQAALSLLGTASNAFGFIQSGGTISHPNFSTGSLQSSRRFLFATATASGTLISLRFGTGLVSRSQGFRYRKRFGMNSLVAGQRVFTGLADTFTIPVNVDPLVSSVVGRVGLACNTNSGNWQLIHCADGDAPTVIDLGLDFPLNTNDALEMILFALPGDSGISYEITNLETNIKTAGILTTNIPDSTLYLSPRFWLTNNATSAALGVATILMELTAP